MGYKTSCGFVDSRRDARNGDTAQGRRPQSADQSAPRSSMLQSGKDNADEEDIMLLPWTEQWLGKHGTEGSRLAARARQPEFVSGRGG